MLIIDVFSENSTYGKAMITFKTHAISNSEELVFNIKMQILVIAIRSNRYRNLMAIVNACRQAIQLTYARANECYISIWLKKLKTNFKTIKKFIVACYHVEHIKMLHQLLADNSTRLIIKLLSLTWSKLPLVLMSFWSSCESRWPSLVLLDDVPEQALVMESSLVRLLVCVNDGWSTTVSPVMVW